MKKSKIFFITGTAFLSLTASISIPIANNHILNQKGVIESINSSKNSSDEQVKYPLIPAQANGQNSFLSTKTGPLVYWDNKITSLDWFGAKRWEIDMTDYVKVQTSGDWNRAWYNWDYDRQRDILWVLGFQFSKENPQTIFAFNGSDGKLRGKYQITQDVTPDYKGSTYRFISALSSGKVLVYGGAKLPSYNGEAILIDPTNNLVKKLKGDSGNIPKPDEHKNTSKMYLFNIIPIDTNRNIVEYVNFDTGGPTVGDNSSGRASYNVYFTLVDDNLDMVVPYTNSRDKWHESVKVVDGVPNYRNTKITPQRDYYFLLDGRVVTILYNTVVIINPNDNTVSSSTNTGVSFQTYGLDITKWVLSWTFDTDENLFFKYKDDNKVYKVRSTEMKNKGFHDSKFDVSQRTYYDVSGSSTDEAKKYGNNFILYNVYGYSGQIMLINAWYSDTINVTSSPKEPSIKENQYGLALAITPNKDQPDSGDTKGLLNGEKSFQKSADFEIKPEILSSKLPSEITRNDITITNNGFFTTNSSKVENKLLYPPFTISDIDDRNGSFKIKVNLDQIPWFTNKLPSDAIPKTIEKTFEKNSAQTIDKKTSWKSDDTLSYDFKNTLPTDLTTKDIEDFDPFQVSFSSQTIIDSSGNVLYPKKIYSKGNATNENGKVVINIDYKYVPLGVTYSSESDVKTYHTTNTYTIFNSSTTKEFYFAGSNNAATSEGNGEINISTVPQLKALSQSNLLPSSFNGKNKSDFLQFINTNKSKGYPVSKTNFDVEANDIEGSLIITAITNNGTFKQKYVGFNKTNQYSFGFKESSIIDQKQFSTMLPSSVNEGDIIDNLVTYTGFNSSDFTVQLYPDDLSGSLRVDILLNRNYANSLGNSSGFREYKASKTFNGFMTTEQYNGKYNVTFKLDNDASLVEIKKNTLDIIYNQIKIEGSNEINNNKEITIKGTTYKNLNDLIQKVFVDSIGSNIPQDWSKDTTKIKTNMAIDNQAGTMNLSISISKDLLDGYDSDLNYVVSYSGFSQGNIVATQDSLTFVSNNLLSAVLDKEILKKKPSEFKEWLLEGNNINKIIFNVTGQYVELLKNKDNYSLDIQTNDAYGDITITLTFTGTISDANSLKQYSIQYNLNNR